MIFDSARDHLPTLKRVLHFRREAGILFTKVTRPLNYQYANAFGAAIAQVSGQIDKIYSLENTNRRDVINTAKELAIKKGINAGADPNTIQVVEIEEIALPYLPANAVRIRVKAVGDLFFSCKYDQCNSYEKI